MFKRVTQIFLTSFDEMNETMNFKNLNTIQKICSSPYSINQLRKKIENALIDPCALVHDDLSYDDIFKTMNCLNVIMRFTNLTFTPLNMINLEFLYTTPTQKTYIEKLLD